MKLRGIYFEVKLLFKFNIFKIFIQKTNQIKNQKKLLESVKPGDLVWAKMPLPKKELKQIEENHQIRPYLIAHKDKFNIYAYKSSSKNYERLNNYEEYSINSLRYNRNKNSFIDLTKIYKIPFLNLKSRYITLNQFDLKNIEKRLQIQANKNNKNIFQFPIDIYILEGDVIEVDNQLYYVYASDNVYIYCLNLFKYNPKDIKKYEIISINSKMYYVSFKEMTNFKRTTKMNIVDIAYKSEKEVILEKKFLSKKALKK